MPNNNGKKIVDEVKIYWTVQIATAGVLGYLGSNLDVDQTESDPMNIFVLAVGYLLLTLGSAYNVVGTYYIWDAHRREETENTHVHTFQQTVSYIYLLICGLIGLVAAIEAPDLAKFAGLNWSNASDTVSAVIGFVGGCLINIWIIRCQLGGLLMLAESKRYSEGLSWHYRIVFLLFKKQGKP